MNPKVDEYISRSDNWPEELTAVRDVLLTSGLSEEIKWGKPCYSHGDANIAILQEMKDFLAIMFFKGALLKDPAKILESQGPNSRSALRVCVRSVADVARLATTLSAYIQEAIAVEQAGLEIEPPPELALVDELEQRFQHDAAFKAAFVALTPGRQREYNLHFSDAKQAKTRESRIEKCVPKIMAGKGFRER